MKLPSASCVVIALSLAFPAYGQISVQSGDDLVSGYLSKGQYDLNLLGDVSWNTAFTYASTNTNNLKINGNGHKITFGPATGVYFYFSRNNGSLAINDAVVETQTFAGVRDSLFWIGSAGITTNFDFNGTTFQNIGPTNFNLYASGNYSPIISQRVNSVTNIDGGAKGVVFKGNHGLADQSGTIGISSGTMNFLNNVTFDSNWGANYSGAMAIYPDAAPTVNFNGTTLFNNNHTGHYGGAIDMWGGNGTLVFNGDTSFTNNYTYSIMGATQDFPNHYTDRSASGGAIHMGFIASAGTTGTSVTFNGDATFDGNFVNDLKTTAYNNAQGGAIGLNQSREAGTHNYNLFMNGHSTFNNNYVYSLNGSGYGGAIFLNAQGGSANIAGAAEFTNNSAKTLGGAIYIRKGSLNINANTGDIVFRGNRQGSTFVSENRTLDTGNSYTFYKPVEGTGTPNAIYWETSNTLNLDGTQGNAIRFYDPLSLVAGGTLTLNQNGTGETAFYGDNGASTAYDTDINVNTTVNGGTFTVADGVKYGRTTFGTFDLNSGATLKGENSGTLKVATLNLNNGTSLDVEGGTLMLDSAAIALGNAVNGTVNLTGYGTLNSSSALKAAYAGTSVNATIGLDSSGNAEELRLEAPISGTAKLVKNGEGTLLLPTVQGYTDGTVVNEGTLVLTENGTLGSGSATVNANGTLEIDSPASGNVSFGNALLGTGLLKVGLASGTNTFDFASSAGTAFAGTVELNDGTFSLSGTNTAVLGNSTLRLNAGSTTNVGAGTQAVGNMELNGGLLRFPNLPTGVIQTGVLNLGSGTVQVNADTSAISAKPLLQQDDGNTNQLLIGANTVQGSASNLVLQDLSGSVSGTVQSNVQQDGNTVAVASYAYGLTSVSDSPGNNGLFTSYRLTQLDLQNNRTLTLSGDATTPAGANDMKAKITGSGNLAIDATGTIILANANNDYSGNTSVNTGTLQLGTDHALGNTSLLTIADGASTDINGKTQTVDSLVGAGSLNVNGGNLTVSNGGYFSGVMSGNAGALTLAGGDLILSGANTFTGTTTQTSGLLQIGSGGTSGSYAGNIVAGGTVAFNRSDSSEYGGVISGDGNLVKSSTGTLTLTGNNTYGGGTQINAGTLAVGNGGTSGSIAGDVTNNGKLAFNRGDDITFGGVITGSGSLDKSGNGKLTLTAENAYAGTTVVNNGTLALLQENAAGTGTISLADTTTLQLGFNNGVFDNSIFGFAGSTVSVLGSNITLGVSNPVFSGTWNVTGSANISTPGNLGNGSVSLAGDLNLNAQAGNYAFNNALSGAGDLNVTMASGSDVFSFSNAANNGFTGTLSLGSGRFELSGANTPVLANASLQLNNGNVTTVGDGEQAIGNLNLNGGSLAWDGFTTPEENPNGTISTDNLALSGGQIRVDMSAAGESNPPASGGSNLLQQDDGNVSSKLISAGHVTGDISNIQLSDLNGNALAANQVVGVVENNVKVADASYNYGLTTGSGNDGVYLNYGLTQLDILANQTLTLSGDETTPDGASDMKAKITGSGNLAINATDKIILANTTNDYTGSTTVNSGTLQLGTDHALGNTSLLDIAAGATTDMNGKTQTVGALGGAGSLNVNSGNLTVSNGGDFGGVIAGDTGTVDLKGGTLTLTGANTFTGTTTVTSGSLQVGNGGTTGSYAGNIANEGSVIFNRSDDIAYGGVVNGSGNLVKDGNGTLTLTGVNAYTGGTEVNAGTLQIGDGGTNGIIIGDIANAGGVVFNRSDDIAFGGVISGNGSMSKEGNGVLTLTADQTYTGTTSVNAGTLAIGNGGTGGSITGDIANAGSVVFNRSDNLAYGGVISGTGQVEQAGNGTLTLTGNNTYDGGTQVSDGTLRLTGAGTPGSGTVNIASQGTLLVDSPNGNAYTFNNRLEGDGQLQVAMGSETDTFDFASGAGSRFTGKMNFDKGSMTLGDANTAALSQATLDLGENATVTMDGDRTIGNLTFGGGQLNTTLKNGTNVNVLTVGYLDVNADDSPAVPGTVNYVGGTLNPEPDRSGNLLLQGDINANNSIAIVRADSVSSVGTQLELLMDGVAPQDKTVVTTDGFGNDDLRATYGYMAVITDKKADNMTGLFGGYVLKTLESQTNAILDSTTAPDANFGAKLTGAGNFEFRANDNSITLVNAANDYGGQTTAASGTLNMGTNNVFGQTSALNIKNSATVNMNGHTQTVGELNGEDGSTLDLGGGSLTVTAGGNSNGILSGAGNLHLTGGTLVVANANENLSAAVDIQSGATAQLLSTKGLGSGDISLAGQLQFSGAQGTLANRLNGAGAVTLADGSNMNFSADNSAFSGSVDIGSGTTLSASAGSQLGTASLANNGNLVLHSDGDWTFTNAMSGSGKLVKEGDGIIRVSSEYAHSGGTEITHGSLVMDNPASALSGSGDVRIAEGATLAGYGSIGGSVFNFGTLAVGNGSELLRSATTGTLTIAGGLTNSGAIHLGGAAVGNVLRVQGNFTGGGTLMLNTVLGDDTSATDKLVVEGNTSGSTAVIVNNKGGLGADTHNGIQIVQVDGASDGNFYLGSRVVQGAYDYRLYKGSIDNPDDGDWYLRSTRNDPTPVIRPEIGAYLANRDAAQTMFRHTLHDRMGESAFSEGKVASKNAPAFWSYVEAGYGTGRAAGQIDQRRWSNKVQVGGDFYRSAEDVNNWRVGAMAGYGTLRSRSLTDGQAYRADSDLTGYNAGLYATWFADGKAGADGPYLDGWIQHGWFRNKVKGDELAEQRYNSRAWSGSVEGGWTFNAWSTNDYRFYVQPQVQVIYTRYHGNDVIENNGTVIENSHEDGISTRLGARFFGNGTGAGSRWQPYAELNWLHNNKASTIRIGDESFDSALPKNVAELKAGFEVVLNKNTNAWAQVRMQKGEDNYKSVGGLAGIKVSW